MLSTIREKTQGIIATFIIALIAIPFALWGINSYFEGGSNTAVAKVNGTPIRQPTYQAAIEQLRAVDAAQRDNRAMRELVLEGLINQVLLMDDAHERGYRLSDARLAQMIREAPYFQRDGRFDGGLYQVLLQREGTSAPEFEARLRRENLTSQVQRGLADTAFVTQSDVATVAQLLQQERRISYAVVTPQAFAKRVRVTPEEIETYYNEQRDAFLTAEQVRVEYVRLAATDALKRYQPTEEGLRQAYAAEAGRYTTPAKRRASHILIGVPAGASADDEAKAKARIDDIERQLRAGGDFAKLARANSEDPESATKGGDLGTITPGMLPAELEQALNGLKANEVSKPVRTPFGYHLVKLTQYTPEQRVTFEQARKELTELVRRRQGEERFFEQAERLRTLAYEHPESLAPAAKDLGLTVEQSDWFTRNGGPGIAANARVAEVAFNPEQISSRRNSDVIELSGDTLLALRVIDHKPSSRRPLAEVRAEIERTLTAARAREQAQALSAEWLDQLKQGADLAQVARAAGITPMLDKPITREQAAGVDRRIVDAAFAAPRPAGTRASYDRVDLGPQGYAVVAVTAVRDGETAKTDKAVMERVKRQLLARRGAEYYAHYRAGLRRDADITIYPDQL